MTLVDLDLLWMVGVYLFWIFILFHVVKDL